MSLFDKLRKSKAEKADKAKKQALLEEIKSYRDSLYEVLGLNHLGEPTRKAQPIETWNREQREFRIYRNLLAIEDKGVVLGRVMSFFRRYDFFEREYGEYKGKIKSERNMMRR